MKRRALQIALIGLVASSLGVASLAVGQEAQAKRRKVTKTDAEWRKLLTRDQYLVTRQAETEPAGTGKLLHNKAKGIYECVCCGTALFSSKAKFESGTGWPSFYAPYAQANIDTSTDYKLGYARTEVMCSTCGAHLGHVFDDAVDQPTGLRFCMNSAALKFVKDTPATKEKAEKTAKTEKADKSEKKEEPTKDKEAPAKEKETPATETPK